MKYLMLLIYLLLPTATWAQDFERCDSVLEYAGREYRLSMESESQEKYAAYQSAKSSSGKLKIPVKKLIVGGEFASAKQRSSVTWEQFERVLIDQADTVYGPAVDAWATCAAAGLGIIVEPSGDPTHDVLDLKISIGSGYSSKISGLAKSSNVRCERNGQELSQADFPMDIDGSQAISLRCVRKAGSNALLREKIVVETIGGEANPVFYLPWKRFPKVPWNDKNSKLLRRSDSHRGSFVVSADNYQDRVLDISYNVRVVGSCGSNSATLRVALNGVSTEQTRASGDNCAHTARYSDRFELKAGQPGLLEWGVSDSSNVSSYLIRDTGITVRVMPASWSVNCEDCQNEQPTALDLGVGAQ